MIRVRSLIREHKLLSALAGCTVAGDVAYYALHNIVQSYRALRISCTEVGSSSEMLGVSEDLRSKLQEAGARLGIPQSRLERVELFVCRCVDPVRMGTLSLSFLRAFLGLPVHFDYKATDTEQRHSFFFDEHTLSLNTKKGKQLYREGLVLNDHEKGFVLARELCYLTSYNLHAVPFFASLGSVGLGTNLYWLLHGKGANLMETTAFASRFGKHKGSISVVVSCVAVGVWFAMSRQWYAAYWKSLDFRVDRRAAAAYPQGAATFYEKQVKRNTLLRAILGEQVGGSYFTVKGNEKGGWVFSDPFLPVNQRWSKLKYGQQNSRPAVE